MKVKQHSGHAEPEQPKGRRIRCRVLEVSSGFIHGESSVAKERATMQEGMASPVRSISVVALSRRLAIGRLVDSPIPPLQHTSQRFRLSAHLR